MADSHGKHDTVEVYEKREGKWIVTEKGIRWMMHKLMKQKKVKLQDYYTRKIKKYIE